MWKESPANSSHLPRAANGVALQIRGSKCTRRFYHSENEKKKRKKPQYVACSITEQQLMLWAETKMKVKLQGAVTIPTMHMSILRLTLSFSWRNMYVPQQWVLLEKWVIHSWPWLEFYPLSSLGKWSPASVFPKAQAFEAASRPGLSALISCSAYVYSVRESRERIWE